MKEIDTEGVEPKTFPHRFTKQLGYGLLIIALMAYTWKEHVEDRIIPKRWGVVEAGSIYRSGQLHPALIERVLLEHDIKAIVDLNGKRAGKIEHETEDLVAEKLGIVKKRYPLNGDGTGEIEQYAQAIADIHSAVSQQRPVLVHCSAGSQRTGGVIAMYRYLVQGRSVDDALSEMERYNWDPKKDETLTRYLDTHVEELAERLVKLSVIPEVPTEYQRFQRQESLPSSD